MHDLQTLRDGGYRNAGLTKLKLACALESFPVEILELGDTLENLDLSGTGLSSLPSDFGPSLPNLKTAFFSSCNFAAFPRELSACPSLEMVAFRSNGMAHVPDDAFPPRLRWLILTDNRIPALPASIGRCSRLQKCMLAGNRLTDLPPEMAACTKLGLLRLSANRFESLPDWLFRMPELAFLSFASNPFTLFTGLTNGTSPEGYLTDIPWSDLEVKEILGQGASGIISRAVWRRQTVVDSNAAESHHVQDVAVKLFRGALTSDGRPADEMAACLAASRPTAGKHPNLIDVYGRVAGHPDEAATGSAFCGGIVMQLIPPHYRVLGQSPSLTSCTRDVYDHTAPRLLPHRAVALLAAIASAARHLHSQNIAHGDLYAHNILLSDEDGHALLGDFGAATIYRTGRSETVTSANDIQALEMLAFGHLIEDVLGLLREAEGDEARGIRNALTELHARCSTPQVDARPSFRDVVDELQGMLVR